jgi:Na+/phosphate symporter
MPLRELMIQVYGLFPKLIEAVELLQRGLIYNNLQSLEEAERLAREVLKKEHAMTEEVIKLSADFPQAGRYIPIPGHIERIGNYIENMSRALRVKARENILFSDKAMDEMNFLFEKIKDILGNTADMVLARNLIIAGYIREAESSVERSANKFATLHEERLIEGLCLPKASAIYLELLDAFKAVSWHSKEIVQRLMD